MILALVAAAVATFVLLTVCGIGAFVLFLRDSGATGSTTMTALVLRPDGSEAGRAALEQVRDLLVRRATGAGLTVDTSEVRDARSVSVTVDGTGRAAALTELTAVGQLQFRRVTGLTPAEGPPAASPAAPGPQPPAEQVAAKLGDAYRLAETLPDPAAGAAAADRLAAFGLLSPSEVAVLPARMQFVVPQVGCPALNARPYTALTPADRAATACDDAAKYLLEPSRVGNDDISDARAERSAQGWTVTLAFTPSGQARWTELTRQAVAAPDGTGRQVAIVLDSTVLVAPTIQSEITGDAQVSGNLTAERARALAANLRAGLLPAQVVSTQVTESR
jgi:preprotein translocase subunit SecD